MIAGQLEVVMMANMARLADDMAKSKAVVGEAMKGIEGAVASAKSALGALGIGLSVGYFVTLIRGSIDAMDHLNDLSKTTKITVETLSGLKVAAKQSGSDLDSTAASINKLSVEVGKAPEKFKALGISANDPLEQFKQLADITNKLSDVNQRNAVLAAALGKSWQGAVPLLSEGSEKIGEMVAKGAEASRVTEDMVRKADELNDKWELLVGTGGLLNTMVGNMLTPLLNLTNQMLAAKEASTGWYDAIGRFFGIGGNQAASPLEALDAIDKRLAKLREMQESLRGPGIAQWFNRMIAPEDLAILAQQIAFAEQQRSVLLKLVRDMPVAPGGAMDMGGSGNIFGASDAAARAAAFLKTESEQKESLRIYQDQIRAFEAMEAERYRLQLSVAEKAHAERLEAERLFALQSLELEEVIQDELDRIQREKVLGRQEIARQEVEIEQQKNDLIRNMQMATWQLAAGLLQQFAGKSRAAAILTIAINKALSIAQAIQNTAVAFTKALTVDPTGALAARVALLGKVQIGLIAATGFAEAANVGSGGASPGSPANPISTTGGFSQPQASQPSSIVLNLTVNGHILDTQEFTDTILVPALKDAIDNRDVTIIGANSRQAANLAG